ncbi:hypothetical protein [Pseudoduganella chitinolytica]|uniref:Uncharacterized protein n=1 Tax=Pseudoduganella chitinolytica TaxID=34070 RepID=A0ABY8B6C9_9BURK|nr:hypothetical protein [Pseudoduganella chitinolytica]WEF31485.1 hypothetical protein PX653_18735 [Pseudoduganella chitinolytica]
MRPVVGVDGAVQRHPRQARAQAPEPADGAGDEARPRQCIDALAGLVARARAEQQRQPA